MSAKAFATSKHLSLDGKRTPGKRPTGKVMPRPNCLRANPDKTLLGKLSSSKPPAGKPMVMDALCMTTPTHTVTMSNCTKCLGN